MQNANYANMQISMTENWIPKQVKAVVFAILNNEDIFFVALKQ